MKQRRSGPPGRRPRRVAEQVRAVVTTFLQEEARDPRIGFVTVTDVVLSGDLQHATVRYVVHGGAEERVATQSGLTKAVPAVRRRIGQELALRVVPALSFELDQGRDHAAHIDRLLAGLDRPAAETPGEGEGEGDEPDGAAGDPRP